MLIFRGIRAISFFSGATQPVFYESIPPKKCGKKVVVSKMRIWMFPKIGVPPIIHFFEFSILNHPFWGNTHIVSTWVGLGSKIHQNSDRGFCSDSIGRFIPRSLRWISPSCYAALRVLALRRWSWTSVTQPGNAFCRDGSLGKFSEAFRKFW